MESLDDRLLTPPCRVHGAAVIFDGDDTLWWTEPIYDAARAAARVEVELAGLDGDRWEAIERARDVENVGRFGLSRIRFPTSCVEAYRELVVGESVLVDAEVEQRVWRAAEAVFERPAPLAHGAEVVLGGLRSDFALALLTKGDPEVQRARILGSGLEVYFDLIEIVDHKDAIAFDRAARALGCVVSSSWSVGNSWASDVVPAVAAGMRAIWVPAHVWEYEGHSGDESHPSVIRVASLYEVPETIHREQALA